MLSSLDYVPITISELTSSRNAWNKTFLSVLLILFTFMFKILRAFPVVLRSSLTIVVSVWLKSGDDVYDGSSGNVHLGQKKVNESWSILLIRDAHTHSMGPSVALIAAHRGILIPYIPLANCARIATPRSRVTLNIAS